MAAQRRPRPASRRRAAMSRTTSAQSILSIAIISRRSSMAMRLRKSLELPDTAYSLFTLIAARISTHRTRRRHRGQHRPERRRWQRSTEGDRHGPSGRRPMSAMLSGYTYRPAGIPPPCSYPLGRFDATWSLPLRDRRASIAGRFKAKVNVASTTEAVLAPARPCKSVAGMSAGIPALTRRHWVGPVRRSPGTVPTEACCSHLCSSEVPQSWQPVIFWESF